MSDIFHPAFHDKEREKVNTGLDAVRIISGNLYRSDFFKSNELIVKNRKLKKNFDDLI